ncbi:MAG: hypothetical protein M4D80_40015 [Myxococcota bacterium]|nr:hypothetical protein [Myxococcota bacterium]
MKRVALFMLLAACTENRDALTGTQSIEVEMVTPANPGTVNNRLDTERTIVVNLRAKDAAGNLDTSFNADIRIYAQYLGTLTPSLESMPIKTVAMTGGVANNVSFDLLDTFGPTTVWFDNGTGLGPDYQYGEVSGTSPTLWYRDPFIRDLQQPRDEAAVNALSDSPLEDKQVRVGGSRTPGTGVLVVTSVFAQGYTVSDVSCATGGAEPTPPCTAGNYDHVMVFTFSSPRDQYGRPIVEGEVIESFAGGVTEFNGLTEIGFPRTFISAPNRDVPPYVNRALMPTPVPLFESTWFTGAAQINFERHEAGAIDIRNAKVCPLDDGPDGVYTKYKQWSIDPADVPPDVPPADDCGKSNQVINLITAGTDFTTDPRTLVGKTLPKVIGIVRPVNIGSFNVWIVYPRGKDDLQTQ